MKNTIILSAILLSVSINAERKTLQKIPYQIKPGKSSVVKKSRKKGRVKKEMVTKRHKVKYDPKKELYIYTYYKGDGSKILLTRELANKMKITTKCNIDYLYKKNIYKYTYTVYNQKNSQQPLTSWGLDIDRSIVLDTKVMGGWLYYSKEPALQGRPKWAFFGSLERNIMQGEILQITIFSKYAPVIATIYAVGRPKRYPKPKEMKPHESIDALGRRPPNIEGVKGKTLAPGKGPKNKEERVEYLKKFLVTAKEWGWIGKEKYVTFSSLLKRGKSLGPVLKKYKQMEKKTTFEPEVRSVFKYLARLELEK